MHIDKELWHRELESHDELFNRLKERMPRELMLIREMLNLSLVRDMSDQA
jgi:phosphoenolpyruvate carboxykinase (GTP)